MDIIRSNSQMLSDVQVNTVSIDLLQMTSGILVSDENGCRCSFGSNLCVPPLDEDLDMV